MSLGNLGMEFISKGRQIYHYNLSDIVDSDPTVFWVNFNGFQNVRTAFNNSIIIADSRSAKQADRMDQTNWIVLGISLSLLVVISLLFMVRSLVQ